MERLTGRRLRRVERTVGDALLMRAVEHVARGMALTAAEVLSETRAIEAWVAWDRVCRPPRRGVDPVADTTRRLAAWEGIDEGLLLRRAEELATERENLA